MILKNYILASLLLASVDAVSQTNEEPKVQAPKQYEENIQTVEEPAEYPGGRGEMMKYLASNIVYPKSALENEVQGKCWLKFVVGTDGSLSDIQVVRGVPDCPECDAEAIRVVKGMPKWIPGKIGGKPVKSYYNLPITFKLN